MTLSQGLSWSSFITHVKFFSAWTRSYNYNKCLTTYDFHPVDDKTGGKKKSTVWLMRNGNLWRRGVCVWERERERERERESETSPLRMDKFSVHRSLVWDNSTWGRQECLRMLPVLAVSLKIAKRLRTSLTLTYCSCRALYYRAVFAWESI